jgi:hypothetical protein
MLVGATGARADGKELDRTPVQCVAEQGIAANEAVSDRAVLFFVRSKTAPIYRNDLKAVCSTLHKGETQFDYIKAQAGKKQLCSGDGFKVHRKEQLPCTLGTFQPITPEEAEKLLGRPLATEGGAQPTKKN